MVQVFAAPSFAHYPGEWHLSPVACVPGFAFLSGQTGTRPDGTVSDDPETQFRDAFRFLSQNLAAADLELSDVIEMTTYHVDLRKHLAAFIRVKDEHIRASYPAWTAIGISELITEGTLLEIRIIAKKP